MKKNGRTKNGRTHKTQKRKKNKTKKRGGCNCNKKNGQFNVTNNPTFKII